MDFFLKFINEWRKARRVDLGLFLFAFLALIIISYLGVFNNNFLSRTETQSFFSPSVAKACSSNDYACLACQNVSCPASCSGYTYTSQGQCNYSDGFTSCIYPYPPTYNSPSCGYGVDPCAGVSCPQEQCVGYDMVYSSHCSNGSCIYDDYDHNTSYCCYGVTCNNYCSGYTYYRGGSCIQGGSCNYSSILNNYPGCGYNICSGVVCSDSCSGYTLYPGGSCNTSTGQCTGGTPVPNSPSCGYSPNPCPSSCSGYTYYYNGVYTVSDCPSGCFTSCAYNIEYSSPSCGWVTCGGGHYPGDTWTSSCTVTDGCGNTCTGSQTITCSSNGVSSWSACGGCTPTCNDYCGGDGYTRFSGGYCSGGSCYYTYAYHNSSQCGCTTFYYPDTDGDGYGNSSDPTTFQCYQSPGHVANGSDCDDSNASHWQNLTGYTDADHDGYGTGSAQSICSGASLPVGYAANNTDCNDSNASIYPGTTQTQSCTVTNSCGHTCTGSQTDTCQSNGTYSSWSACGGCTPATCDPCAGVTCDSPYCDGNYTYVYGGYCSGGNCYYSYNYNDGPDCGYVAPPSSVSSVSAQETNGGGGLSATWSGVGASGYLVYVKGGRTNPTNAVLIGNITGTSAPVTLAGQCPGSYTVTVVPYNTASVGTDSSCTTVFGGTSLSGATVPSGMKCGSATVSTVNLKSCTGGFLLE